MICKKVTIFFKYTIQPSPLVLFLFFRGFNNTKG